jgi:predicted O-methyltransferase YrrM
MASDAETGSLLRTLAASKPSVSILELGTGTGLATSWMLHGMDKNAKLISVENNEQLLAIAKRNINDSRIEFIFADGYEWLLNYKGAKFDLIFADTFPGKYDLFEETITLLNIAGIYVIDDMLPQANWPAGHAERVEDFVEKLEKRDDLFITKMNWSTGIIIATKIV